VDIAQAAIKIGAKTQVFGSGPVVAAPYVSAQTLLTELLRTHYLPAAQAFTAQARNLHSALAAPTAAWPSVRSAWVSTLLAWERLSAVAVGPVLERRALRALDFWPTRPAQISRVLGQMSPVGAGPIDMETVGASARGLPALEWLLYRHTGLAAERSFAEACAAHVLQEAQALEQGYAALLQAEREESEAWALYGEWYGQAVGAIDQLRIKRLVADTRGKDSSPWVRGVSGQTRASWSTQVRAIEGFLVGTLQARAAAAQRGPLWPVPGSLDSLLLGRGHIGHSQTLRTVCAQMVRAVEAAAPQRPTSCQAAQRSLVKASALLDHLASEVLQITLGFTDADGD
jgi:hypothetical protein